MKYRITALALFGLLWLLPGAVGAEAANVRVIIEVKDMTCSLCVTAINKALRQTDGVIKAKASLKNKRAEVVVPEGFATDTLLRAIEKTGYTGKILETIPAPEVDTAR